MKSQKVPIYFYILAWVLWVLSLGASYGRHLALIGCPTSSDSIFGRSSWSFLPTGQVCEWDLASGVVASTAPPYITVLIPVILILWGISLYLSARGNSR